MLSVFRASVALLLVTGSVAAPAAIVARNGYLVSLTVPLQCSLKHNPGLSLLGANEYRLGSLQEYCNAARGYRVNLTYSPGSMRGAVVTVGDDQIVLDGSGTATVSVSQGPALRERDLRAIPGAAGFDTDRLDFAIEAM
ncbi:MULTISPECIES: hypothetical protein [Sphingobium]|uniref:hypothetical protein n=1 Tax=Sphingobium sp. MI1205 TaxID=407020 RepID=UPI000A906E69|nr:hypothetical protein [Sphingobium sp. MI1205]